MSNILKNDWKELLEDEFSKDYYQTLRQFLIEEYKTKKYILISMIYLMPYILHHIKI